MRLLTTLYITDHRARVGVQSSALMVAQGDGARMRVPLEALQTVVLACNAQITSEAMAACVRHHVGVTSVRRNGAIRFALRGGISGNVHLRVAQVRAADDPDRVSQIARWLVAGKLQNLRLMLQRWSWDANTPTKRALRRIATMIEDRVAALAAAGDTNAIRGYEGDGTRIYFRGLRLHLAASGSALTFDRRNRRPPRDPINALLSFAYGIVLGEVAGALDSVGLDPQIGFLHGIRAGRPSLALDLVEELRPAVADRFVVGLATRGVLSDADFLHTTGGACYLTDDGRAKFFEAYEQFKSAEVPHRLLGRSLPRASLPVVQATLLARYLRGDLPAYPPYVMVS